MTIDCEASSGISAAVVVVVVVVFAVVMVVVAAAAVVVAVAADLRGFNIFLASLGFHSIDSYLVFEISDQ